MDLKRVKVLVLLGAALLTEPTMSVAGETNSDVDSIRSLMDQTQQGFATRDLDLSLAMYRNSEYMIFDVVAHSGETCCGYDKARQGHKIFFEGTVGPVVTDFSRLSIFTAGDLGYAVGPTRLVFTRSGGEKVSLETRMTLVFKRIDGEWTCVHEHLSVPTTLK